MAKILKRLEKRTQPNIFQEFPSLNGGESYLIPHPETVNNSLINKSNNDPIINKKVTRFSG